MIANIRLNKTFSSYVEIIPLYLTVILMIYAKFKEGRKEVKDDGCSFSYNPCKSKIPSSNTTYGGGDLMYVILLQN